MEQTVAQVGPYVATLAALCGMLWVFVRKHGEPPPYLERYLDSVSETFEAMSESIKEQNRMLASIDRRLHELGGQEGPD